MSKTHRAERSFIEQYLAGTVAAEHIDNFIDAWHDRPENKEIYEFLGMSKEEYSLWLREPDSLLQIARARREGLPLADVIQTKVVRRAKTAGE